MKSVADALRLRNVERVLALPLAERIQLALSLGDQDLDRFMKTSGLDRREALKQLCDAHAHGRQPSACASPRR
jgi:hypothetical protein